MSRWKASGIHLLLSAIIATVVVAFMLTLWYPWPLFDAAGGGRLLLILTGVDVTLGPLITLIVFKSGKKGMKFDLTFIACAQLLALAYGVHTMYIARPVYIAFTVDSFDLVAARDLDPQDLAEATFPQFKHMPLGRPQYIAVVGPQDPLEKAKLIEALMKGKDLHMLPKYYVPYAQEAQNVVKHAHPLGTLLKRAPEAVNSYLTASGLNEGSVRYLPLRGARGDGSVLVDATSGEPLKIVLVDPW